MGGDQQIIAPDWLSHTFQFHPDFCIVYYNVLLQGEDCYEILSTTPRWSKSGAAPPTCTMGNTQRSKSY